MVNQMKVVMYENNLKDFLKLTLKNCMHLLKSKGGSVFLFDNEKQDLALKIYRSSNSRRLSGIRERLGQGVSGVVASKREPILVRDIRIDPRFRNMKRFSHYRTNSFLSVPLVAADKLIGVINISERISGKPFTSKDLQILFLISNYIAVAIHKNQLYEKTRELNQALSAAKDIKDSEQDQLKKFASIGKLVAGIAHELNNPLDGVMRYVNISLGHLNEDGIVREYLMNAKKGLSRIAGTIRSLLDFAQVYSPVFNKPIDINKTIEDSLLMTSHHILINNIKVVKQLNPRLPAACDNGLKLVFINIIKNACDAIGTGGGTIKVSTGIKNRRIEIRFKDTGHGIPEETQKKIFEPFFTTKELGNGSGLGLAICRDIVQRYHGKIYLEQGKGKGANFVIELPVDACLPDRQELNSPRGKNDG